jgi:translation elongation factor EF-1beta
MSEPNRIDAILKSPQGEIVLMISEHRDWKIQSEMKEQLRQKISTYVKYIRSDEYKKQFGILNVKILLMTNVEPTENIKQDIQRYEQATGIKIEYQVFSPFSNK